MLRKRRFTNNSKDSLRLDDVFKIRYKAHKGIAEYNWCGSRKIASIIRNYTPYEYIKLEIKK